MFASITFTLLAVVVSIFLWTICHRLRGGKLAIWSDQNLPQINDVPFVGSLLQILAGPLFEIDTKNCQKYGPIYGFYDGLTPKIMINDVKVIKELMLKHHSVFVNRCSIDFWDSRINKMLLVLPSEQWKKVRAIIASGLTEHRLKVMYKHMDTAVNEMVADLKLKLEVRKAIEIQVKDHWGLLTINIIAKCCFEQELNIYEDKDSQFLRHAKGFFTKRALRLTLLCLLSKPLAKLFKVNLGSQESIDYFANLVSDIIRRRESKKMETDQSDTKGFLGSLIEKTKAAELESHNGNGSQEWRIHFDEEFIIAQSIMFFVGGYETTATALTFALYILAIKPEVQEKLYLEALGSVVDSSEKNPKTIDYDQLKSLKYLEAFILETLRLYPSITRVERVADKDFVIPSKNIRIPKGASVIYSPYVIQRLAENYVDPEAFRPERFLDEEEASITQRRKHSRFVAFGVGQRNCIAEKLSMIEMKLALWKLILNFKVVRTANTSDPLKFVNAMEILSTEPIYVGLEKR